MSTSLDEAWVERDTPYTYVHYRDPRIRSARIDMGGRVEDISMMTWGWSLQPAIFPRLIGKGIIHVSSNR